MKGRCTGTGRNLKPRSRRAYFGGKSRVASLIWDRFGDVPNYVEPFAGSLAVPLGRPTAPKLETVNDVDAMICNFWRALRADPEGVAHHADWPVNENDLHARHLWLVTSGRERVERLTTDPDYYDVKVAGWWVWGISMWIGSSWCQVRHLQMPHLGDAGRGGHRAPLVEAHGEGQSRQRKRGSRAGLWKTRPHLSGEQGVVGISASGSGVERKRPHLMTGDGGKGVQRQALTAGVPRQIVHLGNPGTGVHRPSRGRGGGDGLLDYFEALAERLRRVRVCCGDWTRVLGPSVTEYNGLTAVFLDPPYASERDPDLYRHDDMAVSAAVREWAIANGDNPMLRICVAGYEGEHEMPESWECVAWKAHGGYGSQAQNQARENAKRERLWFSPACLRPDRAMQGALL